MILDRKNNAKRNIVYGILNKIVTLFLPFLVSSVLNQTLGIEYLGINGLFGSLLQVLSLAELGIGDAIVYSMYKPIATNDTPSICALLNLYRRIYRIIGLVILGGGTLAIPVLPLFINGNYPSDTNIIYIYILYLIRTSMSYFLFAYKASLLNAFQRTDVLSKISTITYALTSVFQLVMLYKGENFYIYLWISILCIILNNILIAINVDRLYPEYTCKGKVSREQLIDIKKKVLGLLIGRVCGTTRNTFDNIYMSAFFGLTIAAMYSNYFTIMTAVNGFISIITSSILAGVGNSMVLDSQEKNYNDMKNMDFIYMIISGWCSACMLCLYQPFMELWMGETLLFPMGMVILFTLYFYIRKMGDIRCLYSDAAGLFWENRNRYIGEIIANIVLNYVFVVKWGTYGIVLATIFTLFCFGFLGAAHVLFRKRFEHQIKEYLKSHFIYFSITVIIAGIVYYVCGMLIFDGWIGLFVKGLTCSLLSLTLYLLAYCKTNRFKEAIRWIRKVIL